MTTPAAAPLPVVEENGNGNGKDRKRSRWLEDFGFVVGIFNATAYSFGVKIGTAEPPAWAVVLLTLTLVAPKMIGRATTGRVWEAVIGRKFPPTGGPT